MSLDSFDLHTFSCFPFNFHAKTIFLNRLNQQIFIFRNIFMNSPLCVAYWRDFVLNFVFSLVWGYVYQPKFQALTDISCSELFWVVLQGRRTRSKTSRRDWTQRDDRTAQKLSQSSLFSQFSISSSLPTGSFHEFDRTLGEFASTIELTTSHSISKYLLGVD